MKSNFCGQYLIGGTGTVSYQQQDGSPPCCQANDAWQDDLQTQKNICHIHVLQLWSTARITFTSARKWLLKTLTNHTTCKKTQGIDRNKNTFNLLFPSKSHWVDDWQLEQSLDLGGAVTCKSCLCLVPAGFFSKHKSRPQLHWHLFFFLTANVSLMQCNAITVR